jgi:serine/threonine protein kinase/formylglycine-generating enzyme required for sulfatase activity
MVELTCLADETLQAYQSGTVDPAIFEAVADHLNGCTACLHRLQSVESANDPLLRALRGQQTRPSAPIDPLVASAIAEALPLGSMPAAGTILNEYRLLERLGVGGMGAVYRALHLRLDKQVALKVIHPLRFHDPLLRSRFQLEMKAIGKLRHPHVVLATDAGECQGVLYLVMELEQGADLAHYVREQGRLPIAEACGFAQQAALGLQYAHEAGLVHRDVKPSNLFRTSDSRIKLLDLGLALLQVEKELADLPQTHPPPVALADSSPFSRDGTRGAMGTADYMAPEQWSDSHEVDARADLYSLGCTLFYLLTGRPPFAQSGPPSRAECRAAHLHASPPRLRDLRPDAPARLEALVMRLLAKRPEDRFASAGEVARQLAAFAHPKSRRALLAGTAGLLLVGAITVPVVLNWPSEPVATTNQEAIVPAPDEFAGPPQPGTLSLTPDEAQRLQKHWAKHLGQPAVFQNSLEADLALIPPGEFTLINGYDVVIGQPYYLGVTEVTVGQFRAFVEATKHRTWAESNGLGGVLINAGNSGKMQRHPDTIWSAPGFLLESDDCPVVQVSWDDAIAFCDWLSRDEGSIYRLPTVAESIWASRAGYPGQYHAGGQDGLLEVAWFGDNSENRARPVARLKPNPWGLFDMLGNVREWCLDDLQRENRVGRFPDLIAPATGEFRTATGSDYAGYSASYGIVDRYRPASAASTLGFRILCELKSDKSDLP